MRNASTHPKLVIQVDPELAGLVPGYLESRRKDLTLLRGALLTGTFTTLSTLGHRMRGTGPSFGFEGMGEIGLRLEEAAIAQDAARCRTEIDLLEAYLDSLEVNYQGTERAA